MSHEIRTPMNSILGFADMMKELVDSDLEREYVENIRKSGQNLLKLINDVLDLSKIEAGKKDVNIRPINIERVLDEIQSMFSLKAGDKGLQVRLNIDDDMPASLLLDETKIRQILLNLVGNAVKFTQQGFVEIGARSEEFQKIESRIKLEIYVKDTGRGISEDKQEAIFREFEQEDSSISDEFGGTGLGLAISSRLARLMNGSIAVQSNKDEGSTFTLSIPEVSIATMLEEAQEESDEEYDIVLKSGTILVVDDIRLNRRLVVEFLKGYPIQVLEAKNGLEAVDIASREDLDLIFMDIKMAQLDGVEAMSQIKQQRETLPIVALTASAFDYHNEVKGEDWFDGYLRKPVNRSQIVQELAKYIGIREGKEGEPSSKKDVEKAEEISGQTISKQEKKKLLKTLESKISGIIAELDTESIMMDQYKELLKKMRAIEEKFAAEQLVQFNNKLKSAIDLFDIEQIRNLITNKYPQLIEDLKK